MSPERPHESALEPSRSEPCGKAPFFRPPLRCFSVVIFRLPIIGYCSKNCVIPLRAIITHRARSSFTETHRDLVSNKLHSVTLCAALGVLCVKKYISAGLTHFSEHSRLLGNKSLATNIQTGLLHFWYNLFRLNFMPEVKKPEID